MAVCLDFRVQSDSPAEASPGTNKISQNFRDSNQRSLRPDANALSTKLPHNSPMDESIGALASGYGSLLSLVWDPS